MALLDPTVFLDHLRRVDALVTHLYTRTEERPAVEAELQRLFWGAQAESLSQARVAAGEPRLTAHEAASLPAALSVHISTLQLFPPTPGAPLAASEYTATFAAASISMCMQNHWLALSMEERWSLVDALLQWLTSACARGRVGAHVFQPLLRGIARATRLSCTADTRYHAVLVTLTSLMRTATSRVTAGLRDGADADVMHTDMVAVSVGLYEAMLAQWQVHAGDDGLQAGDPVVNAVVFRDTMLRPAFDCLSQCVLAVSEQLHAVPAAELLQVQRLTRAHALCDTLGLLAAAVERTFAIQFGRSAEQQANARDTELKPGTTATNEDDDDALCEMPATWVIMRQPTSACGVILAAQACLLRVEECTAEARRGPAASARSCTALQSALMEAACSCLRATTAFANTRSDGWHAAIVRNRASFLLRHSVKLMLALEGIERAGAPESPLVSVALLRTHEEWVDLRLEVFRLCVRVAAALEPEDLDSQALTMLWLQSLWVCATRALAAHHAAPSVREVDASAMLLVKAWARVSTTIAFYSPKNSSVSRCASLAISSMVPLVLEALTDPSGHLLMPTAGDDLRGNSEMETWAAVVTELAALRLNASLLHLGDRINTLLRDLHPATADLCESSDTAAKLNCISFAVYCASGLLGVQEYAIGSGLYSFAAADSGDADSVGPSGVHMAIDRIVASAVESGGTIGILQLLFADSALFGASESHPEARSASGTPSRSTQWIRNPLVFGSTISKGSGPDLSSLLPQLATLFSPAQRRNRLMIDRLRATNSSLSPIPEAMESGDDDAPSKIPGAASPDPVVPVPMFVGAFDSSTSRSDVLGTNTSAPLGSSTPEVTHTWMALLRAFACLRAWNMRARALKDLAHTELLRTRDADDAALDAISVQLLTSLNLGGGAPSSFSAATWMTASEARPAPPPGCEGRLAFWLATMERACVRAVPVLFVLYATWRSRWHLPGDSESPPSSRPRQSLAAKRFGMLDGKLIPLDRLQEDDAHEDEMMAVVPNQNSTGTEVQANALVLLCSQLGASHPSEVLDFILAKLIANIEDDTLKVIAPDVVIDSMRCMRNCVLGSDLLLHGARAGADGEAISTHSAPSAHPSLHSKELARTGEDIVRTVAVRTLLAGTLNRVLDALTAPKFLRFRSDFVETLTRLLFQHVHAVVAPQRLLLASASGSAEQAALPSRRRDTFGIEFASEDSVEVFVFRPTTHEGAGAWFSQYTASLSVRAAQLVEAFQITGSGDDGGRSAYFQLCVSEPVVSGAPASACAQHASGVATFLRDLLGVIRAASTSQEFRVLHDWIQHIHVPVLIFYLASHYRNCHEVLVPLVHVLDAYSRPNAGRIMFPPGNASGYAVFATVARTAVAIIPHLLQRLQLRESGSAKLFRLVLRACCNLLTGRFASLGAIAALGDTAPAQLWHSMLQLVSKVDAQALVQQPKLAAAVQQSLGALATAPMPAPTTALHGASTLRAQPGVQLLARATPWCNELAVPCPQSIAALTALPTPMAVRILERAILAARPRVGVYAGHACRLLHAVLALEYDSRWALRKLSSQPALTAVHTPALMRMTGADASELVSRFDAIATCPTATGRGDMSGAEAGLFGCGWFLTAFTNTCQAISGAGIYGDASDIVDRYAELVLMNAHLRPVAFRAFVKMLTDAVVADHPSGAAVPQLLGDLGAEIEDVSTPTDAKEAKAFRPAYLRVVMRLRGLTAFG